MPRRSSTPRGPRLASFRATRSLKLRQFTSDLEGHPTPRLPWVDVATGSLGQGLCAAVGIALNARRIKSDYRTYVLLGDGETAEGSVWEAAQIAATDRLDSICAVTDVNALGQSGPTQWQHDMQAYASRWTAFGWHSIIVDGHDLAAILDALEEARRTTGQPTMILARTIKGKGISFIEGKGGWHGKPLKKGEEEDKALAELRAQLVTEDEPLGPPPAPRSIARPEPTPAAPAAPPYQLGEMVATREAYGAALARLGAADDRIVALDADVKNSTFSEKFKDEHPERFYENFIAEQVMIGAAMGLAARGAIPVPVDLRRVPDARLRLHPHGRDQPAQHQDGRLARRCLDRRGRPLADGARRPGDDAGTAEHHRALPVATRSAPSGCSTSPRIIPALSTCGPHGRRPR